MGYSIILRKLSSIRGLSLVIPVAMGSMFWHFWEKQLGDERAECPSLVAFRERDLPQCDLVTADGSQ